MISFNLSHLFLEAINLCLQSRCSNYSATWIILSLCLWTSTKMFMHLFLQISLAYSASAHLNTYLQKRCYGGTILKIWWGISDPEVYAEPAKPPQLAPICHPKWPLIDPSLCPVMLACRCYRRMYRCHRSMYRWSCLMFWHVLHVLHGHFTLIRSQIIGFIVGNRPSLTDKFNGEEEKYKSMAGGEICWTSPLREILCNVSRPSWRRLSDADRPQGFLASELT